MRTQTNDVIASLFLCGKEMEDSGQCVSRKFNNLSASILYNALALSLSLYTATFIAECVRAGIQGVGKGQKEAAASIGLTPNQVLKLVVMPQALRIIIPPTTNQYLKRIQNHFHSHT